MKRTIIVSALLVSIYLGLTKMVPLGFAFDEVSGTEPSVSETVSSESISSEAISQSTETTITTTSTEIPKRAEVKELEDNGVTRAYYLDSVMHQRIYDAVNKATITQPVSDEVDKMVLNGSMPPIKKQVSVNHGSADHHVFSTSSGAGQAEGGFTYEVQAVDVKTSDDENYAAEVRIDNPSKTGANYQVKLYTKRLKHIYKQKERVLKVSFKIKTTYNHKTTQGGVSNWWKPTIDTHSETVTVNVPTNIVPHRLEIEAPNLVHSPVRYQANFPNGVLTIPVKPLDHTHFTDNQIRVRFPDLNQPLTVTEAIQKDPSLSYALFFEKNKGDHTFEDSVSVTESDNWAKRIPWDKLTNNVNTTALNSDDFYHQVTISIVDRVNGTVDKKVVPLSLINLREPWVGGSGEGGIKQSVTYVVGQTVSMSQILKDSVMTGNNIADSYFPVNELSHYFYQPSLIESAGILKLNQGHTPSTGKNFLGSETASITMRKVGEQALHLARIKNPVGNDTLAPTVFVKVIDTPDMHVTPYRAYTYHLGRDIQPKDFISQVKIGEQVVSKADYDVELVKQTGIIGDINGSKRTMYESSDGEPVTLKVIYKGNIPTNNNTQVVQSAVKVNWYHAAGQHTAVGNAAKSGVISLLQTKGQPELVSTFGDQDAFNRRDQRLSHFDYSQSVVSLYGKDKNGVVNVAFKRENTGENPTLSPNKMTHTAYGYDNIASYQQAINRKLGTVTPAYGDVLAMGNRPLKENQGSYVYQQGKRTNHSTKWALHDTASHNWARHKTELYELTLNGLRPLILNHFYNDPKKVLRIKSVTDFSSTKLIDFLGEHRDGRVDKTKLKATVDKSTINWQNSQQQNITVTLTEPLATGGHATYEYDIHIKIEMAPITVKHVYLENKETAIRTTTVKDQVLVFNGEADKVIVKATQLESEHFYFQQMTLDQQVLGSQTSQQLLFTDKPQTLYIQYTGESWIDKISNQLFFKGKKMMAPQTLSPQGKTSIEISIKSTAYQPRWVLTAKGNPFMVVKNKQKIPMTLLIADQNISQATAVIHEGSDLAIKLTIGQRKMIANNNHKIAQLLVGENSHDWAKHDVTYRSDIIWQLETTREKKDKGNHLPSEVGD